MYEDIYRKYSRFMADDIVAEIEGRAYTFAGNDRNVLKEMCDEIDKTYPEYSYKFHYLSEIDRISLPVGSSSILLKYIYQFESESCRSVLVSCILLDNRRYKVKIKNLDRIIMDLYHHFRASPYYLPPPGPCRAAHIYMRYDTALTRLKTLKIVPDIIEILKSRRELYILGGTAMAISKKWAPKELGEIVAAHLMNKNVTRTDVGIPEDGGDYRPTAEVIATQSVFNGIQYLRYYPSQENVRIISSYADHENEELAKYAKAQAELMEKKLQEM